MKNKKELNVILALTISLIIIVASAELMLWAKKSFEENHVVSAEELAALPSEIKQNQIRYLIYDGYLDDSSFYLAKDE